MRQGGAFRHRAGIPVSSYLPPPPQQHQLFRALQKLPRQMLCMTHDPLLRRCRAAYGEDTLHHQLSTALALGERHESLRIPRCAAV